MKRLFSMSVSVVIIMLILSGCATAPSETVIQTAIAMTQLANPTSTSSPMPSDTPTTTPLPTSTPTLTKTPTQTPTNTPTVTDTPTPIPPQTQTAQAVAATKTQVSMYRTATISALNTQRTGTAEARKAWATKISAYQTVPWKDLVTYPKKFAGQKVKISGQVFNVNGDTQLQMWIGVYEAVYVVMSSPFSDIYEDSWIVVFGTVSTDENCGTNAYGAEVCQPLLIDAFYYYP